MVNYKNCPEIIKKALYQVIFWVYSIVRPKNFSFYNNLLKYENSFYNTSFFNERSIEIPIAKQFLKDNFQDSVLEIGNVLNHYNFNLNRHVLDKYEIYPGVINDDIEKYFPNSKYKLIISISTLEHVGLDSGETEIDKDKLKRTLNHIVSNLLDDGGLFIVSLPVNYNSNVDSLIFNPNLFQEKFFMIRDNFWFNTWKKIEFENVPKTIKPKPLLIDKVFFGIYRKTSQDGSLER
jgi:hypothetical protein